MKLISLAIFTALLFSACSVMTSTKTPLQHELNSSKPSSITLYALRNYTDTPQAGMRASNIIEGILISEGYKVNNQITNKKLNLQAQLELAKSSNSDYILVGGVSEWRYKTGIDGEPAISLQMRILETNSSNVVWSSTGSDNSWGNASIGTTAQSLIESMLSN